MYIYDMPSSVPHAMGPDGGNQVSQRIWQFLAQLSCEGLSQEEFIAKASSYYAQCSSYLPTQAARSHHSQLPKLETQLRDFSIGDDQHDGGEVYSEKYHEGLESHVNSTPEDMHLEDVQNPVAMMQNDNRSSMGDLQTLRAEYVKTTREWEAAQVEYEEIYAERKSVMRELKAAMVVKDELAKRRFEIEQRMRRLGA